MTGRLRSDPWVSAAELSALKPAEGEAAEEVIALVALPKVVPYWS